MDCLVVTDIKDGIGNVVIELLIGTLFAHKLSELTGYHYKYQGLITPKLMIGHKTVYTDNHKTLVFQIL